MFLNIMDLYSVTFLSFNLSEVSFGYRQHDRRWVGTPEHGGERSMRTLGLVMLVWDIDGVMGGAIFRMLEVVVYKHWWYADMMGMVRRVLV